VSNRRVSAEAVNEVEWASREHVADHDAASLRLHIGEANASPLEVFRRYGASSQLNRAPQGAGQDSFVRQHRSGFEGDALHLLGTGDSDASVCSARLEVVLQDGK
jgi:hypothetical protein